MNVESSLITKFIFRISKLLGFLLCFFILAFIIESLANNYVSSFIGVLLSLFSLDTISRARLTNITDEPIIKYSNKAKNIEAKINVFGNILLLTSIFFSLITVLLPKTLSIFLLLVIKTVIASVLYFALLFVTGFVSNRFRRM